MIGQFWLEFCQDTPRQTLSLGFKSPLLELILRQKHPPLPLLVRLVLILVWVQLTLRAFMSISVRVSL